MAFYYRMRDGRTTNDPDTFIEWLEEQGCGEVSDEYRKMIRTCNVDYSIDIETVDDCGNPVLKEGRTVNGGAK